ncbi:MAG: methylated-DNA--[protein]-cysteine S-methyltransferase [Actinobacteria bacterium]|nr:methylated-DNA--[protein]-cysteine S-methyltransferase [Actinomycetota bacterium]
MTTTQAIDARHHDLIAEAIRYAVGERYRLLREEQTDGPTPGGQTGNGSEPGGLSVADLSAHVHLSESHFRRVFRRWTGVPPRTFLRHLAATEARALLLRRTVLDASVDAGLSSPGRLHDLIVDVDGLTPGEARGGGGGATIAVGVHPTALGPIGVGVTERGVAALRFLDRVDRTSAESGSDEVLGASAQAAVRESWPQARVVWDPDASAEAADWIRGALGRSLRSSPPRLVVRGTNLQIKVWEALLRIPPGSVATYGDVARAVGRPEAVRAVASAIGANPIAVLIPCHRVLRTSGALAGYRWGPERKRALLALEG